MTLKHLTPTHVSLLNQLIEIPTVSPLESAIPPNIFEAQLLYARHASDIGFEVVHHAAPPTDAVSADVTPATVRIAAKQMGSTFLSSQPNLVLRLGPARPRNQILMLNFHMDTVNGFAHSGQDGDRIFGRGAADMKGPGVAILAGVAEALRRHPRFTQDMSVLVQCVAGEEGGAMGVHGTRVLCQAGYSGRLNIFAEPSGGVYFDRATCTMTAAVAIDGSGSTDDDPGAGHNATILLGFLAQHLGYELMGPVTDAGGKLCVAGLHTGDMHNRVYGTGQLLLNFAYPSAVVAARIERWVEAKLASGLAAFRRRFGDVAALRRTAVDAAAICHLNWLKRGLPPLTNRDQEMEGLLASVGWERNPDHCMDRSFTCDAIWSQSPGQYTIVFGPGSLAENGAHTDREFIDLVDLDRFAGQVADLTLAFAAHVAAGKDGTT